MHGKAINMEVVSEYWAVPHMPFSSGLGLQLVVSLKGNKKCSGAVCW